MSESANPFAAPGLYHADCMEAMSHFPDKFFDLAIVDPPYGIQADTFNNGSGASKDAGKYGTAVRMRSKGRLNQGSGKLAGRKLNTSDCSWDCAPPDESYFRELRRVSKHQIIWGGNYFQLPPTRCVIVWDKMQPWENFSQVELAWTSYDRPAMLYRKCNTMPGKIHPTQKPESLYIYLLDHFAHKGDRILDTHAGSASSLVAAHRAGLDAWGFEIDQTYFDLASERLRMEKAQVTMMELMGENPSAPSGHLPCRGEIEFEGMNNGPTAKGGIVHENQLERSAEK